MAQNYLPDEPGRILASEKVLDRIEAASRRHFRDENDKDECFLFIIDGLTQDNYRRLTSFKGKSNFHTYLYSCINSLALDFLRSKFGRKRIPKVVSRLGRWAEEVYKLVCWRRHTFDDAYDIVVIAELYQGTWAEYNSLIDPIQKAPCRQNPHFVSTTDEENRTREIPDSGLTNPMEELLQKLDSERRIKAGRIITQIVDSLSNEDRLLFSLVYGSDSSIASAARTVNMTPVKARRRLNSIRVEIKEKLLAQGVREA